MQVASRICFIIEIKQASNNANQIYMFTYTISGNHAQLIDSERASRRLRNHISRSMDFSTREDKRVS